MFKAKLLKLDEMIEEKVLIEINGLKLIAFAIICPYQLTINEIYKVNLALTFLDDIEITVLPEPKYSVEKSNKGFEYMLYGQVVGDTINIGHEISIQDDIFGEYSYLNKQYVKIRVDRLSIEFI